MFGAFRSLRGALRWTHSRARRPTGRGGAIADHRGPLGAGAPVPPAAFGADAPGRPGELGRAAARPWAAALDARAREAADAAAAPDRPGRSRVRETADGYAETSTSRPPPAPARRAVMDAWTGSLARRRLLLTRVDTSWRGRRAAGPPGLAAAAPGAAAAGRRRARRWPRCDPASSTEAATRAARPTHGRTRGSPARCRRRVTGPARGRRRTSTARQRPRRHLSGGAGQPGRAPRGDGRPGRRPGRLDASAPGARWPARWPTCWPRPRRDAGRAAAPLADPRRGPVAEAAAGVTAGSGGCRSLRRRPGADASSAALPNRSRLIGERPRPTPAAAGPARLPWLAVTTPAAC